ncbi:S-protein homolog 2-like [Rhododendron vialii]|uniref:S-protein homolog 2-like n=1 Tax=Rhododendron vialii TaxID=182163 RepID=UPI00265EBC72|nr:S-protein homolog 2-like [Rhododendron vialii]
MAHFLPFVILIFLLICMQTLCEQGDVKVFFKTTVHIKSAVGGQLRFRCQSKDDDLGNQTLSTGGYYDFHFHPSFNTLLFCHFYWNSLDKSINVYYPNLAGSCEHGLVHYDCFWRVTPTGFYFSNNDKEYAFARSWRVTPTNFYLSNDDKHYRLINSW